MRATALLFTAGNLTVLCLPELPDGSVTAVGAGLWIVLALGLRQPRLTVFALGFLWAWWFAALGLADRLRPAFAGRDVWVTGTVIGVPARRADAVRFDLAVSEPGLPSRLLLSWYRSPDLPRPGERWRLRVRLRQPVASANPGGRDYSAWLFRHGVGAVGYVRADRGNRRVATPAGGQRLSAWRHGIDTALADAVDGHPMAGMLRGLVTGIRDGVSGEQWRVLAATGTIHLMAISGLHVGMLATAAALLVAGLRRTGLVGGHVSTRVLMVSAGGAAALGYALLAGFSLPTRRAVIMLGVGAAALLLRRQLRPGTALAVALALVTVFDPFAALSPGFWMSFVAVAAILFALGVGARRRGLVSGFLWTQAAVTIALTPLLALAGGALPRLAMVANLVAVPVFTCLVVPGALAGGLLVLITDDAGVLLTRFVAWVLGLLWWLIERAATAPWVVGAPGPLESVGLVSGSLLLLGPRAVPGRWLGVPLMLLPLLTGPPAPGPGGFEATVLDVGQGLAAVIRTERHALVYDTGPAFRSGSDMAQLAVVPFLSHVGVARPDRLIVSHDDQDHAGGVASLRRRFPGLTVQAPATVSAFVPDAPCHSGQQWNWDGVHFSVLHPDATSAGRDNDQSCVLRVEGKGGSVLLTGDIEARGEAELLARGFPLQSDVVVAAHHGSATSSSAALIAATRPRWVVFTAGRDNRWGFPAPAVVARWRRGGALPLDTASEGALTFRFRPQRGPDEPRRHRHDVRRFWHPAMESVSMR